MPFNLCQKHEQQESLGKNSTSAGGLGLGWGWLVRDYVRWQRIGGKGVGGRGGGGRSKLLLCGGVVS